MVKSGEPAASSWPLRICYCLIIHRDLSADFVTIHDMDFWHGNHIAVTAFHKQAISPKS